MAEREMLTVFAYDISSDKSRRRVARVLENLASRVQGSVFEVRMTAARAKRTGAAIAPHLGPGDSLRVYAVGAAGQARSRVWGDAAPFEDDADYWLL